MVPIRALQLLVIPNHHVRSNASRHGRLRERWNPFHKPLARFQDLPHPRRLPTIYQLLCRGGINPRPASVLLYTRAQGHSNTVKRSRRSVDRDAQ